MSSVRRSAAEDFTGRADSGFDVRGRRTSEYDFSLPEIARNGDADEKTARNTKKVKKHLTKRKVFDIIADVKCCYGSVGRAHPW